MCKGLAFLHSDRIVHGGLYALALAEHGADWLDLRLGDMAFTIPNINLNSYTVEEAGTIEQRYFLQPLLVTWRSIERTLLQKALSKRLCLRDGRPCSSNQQHFQHRSDGLPYPHEL